MSDLKGSTILATIVPTSSEDTYPTHDSKYGKGGWREVKTLQDRGLVPRERLSQGCVVFVTDLGKPYLLKHKGSSSADDVWELLTPIDTTDIVYTELTSNIWEVNSETRTYSYKNLTDDAEITISNNGSSKQDHYLLLTNTGSEDIDITFAHLLNDTPAQFIANDTSITLESNESVEASVIYIQNKGLVLTWSTVMKYN